MQAETCLTIIQFSGLTLHTKIVIDQQLRLLDSAKVLAAPPYHVSILFTPPRQRCYAYGRKGSFGKIDGSKICSDWLCCFRRLILVLETCYTCPF